MLADAVDKLDTLSWPPEQGFPAFVITYAACRQIQVMIREAVDALPRRGLEIGGLLLGSQEGSDEMVVHDLRPVESNYPVGPTYRVEDRFLRAELTWATRARNVLGFYRSRTDGVLDLDEQDQMLLRLLPADRLTAILLVRQSKTVQAEVKIGFSRNGVVQWSQQTLPLADWIAGNAEQTETPAYAGVAAIETASPIPQPPPQLDFRLPQDDRRTGARTFVGLAAGAVAVIAAIAVLTIARSGHEGVSPSRERSRRTEAAPLASTPPASARGNLPLESAALPSGSEAQPAEVLHRVSLEPSSLRLPTESKPETVGEPVRLAPRSFKAPPVGTRAAGSTLAPSLSELPAAIPVAAVAANPPSVPLPFSPPAAQFSPAGTSSVQFVPPVLSRQTRSVVVPPDLRRLIDHEVQLSLRVSVDAGGRVTSVTPVTRLNRTEQALARAYANAIEAWQFEPSRRNGQVAEGEAILNFRVQPNRNTP